MKKPYLTRLERWARWFLPRPEADDVIADYREIAGDPPRNDAELLRDLGKPRDVIRPLAQKKPYHTWLAVFAGMAACILLPGHSGFGWFSWPLWRLCFEEGGLHLGPALALLGGALALFWFRRRQGETKAPLPKAIPVTLALLLVWIALVFLFYWATIYHLDAFLALWGEAQDWPASPGVTRPVTVLASQWALILLPFFGSLLAVYWLVRARVGDRRWAAAYILALTAILISLETAAELTSMEVTATPYEVSMRARLIQCAVITAIGLAGTGVALC